MALDGVMLHLLKNELLQKYKEARVDKIYMPYKDRAVILLRGFSGVSGRLVISANQKTMGAYITARSTENPEKPSMFCMLMRKHLSSSKLIDIRQDGMERALYFDFLTKNEMGDSVVFTLAGEFISARSNIILINDEGRIIDCSTRSDIETASRILAPGAKYNPPERQNKILPTDTEKILSAVTSSDDSFSSLLHTADGVSPLITREVLNFTSAESGLYALKSAIENGGQPTVVLNEKGEYKDFSYMPISQYGTECKTLSSYSELLDEYYSAAASASHKEHISSELKKHLATLISRTSRKINSRKTDLKKTENREQLRIYGELLKANLYRINNGDTEAQVENYYDESLPIVKIPLKEELSPAKNAERYFKEYKKACNAAGTLNELIEKAKNELFYLNSTLDIVQRAESAAEIAEIKDELSEQGYLKINRKGARKVKPSKPIEYTSPNGFKILVGRNNRQNDTLTLKTASRQDLWFHTKDIHGSHVILSTDGKEPEKEDILFAASLAAFHSKGRMSSSVPVDFTEVFHVKKPSGAPAGKVIYFEQTTVFVNPYVPTSL